MDIFQCNRLIKTSMLFLFVFFGLIYSHDTSLCIKSLKKGESLLENQNPDSAIQIFFKANKQGLSNDSLFYFVSKAFLQKGVLDSALMMHYMISDSLNERFRIDYLLQGYLIFSRLEWGKDVKNVLDTLHRLPQYRARLFLPDFEIGITGGYNRYCQVIDTVSPWYKGSEFEYIASPFSEKADIELTWRIVRNQHTFNWGLNGFVYNSINDLNGLKFDSLALDSATLNGSLFGSVSGNHLSTNVSFSVNRKANDSIFVNGSISERLIEQSNWFPLLQLGASVSMPVNGKYVDPGAYLFTSGVKRIKRKLDLNYSCLFGYFSSQDFLYKLRIHQKMLYAEDARLQYPIFYTDSTYTTVIDTSYVATERERLIKGELKTSIISSAQTRDVVISLKQPTTNITVNPKVSLNVKGKFPLEICMLWRFKYYPEAFEWYRYEKYLIHSKSDNSYYYINDPIVTTNNGKLVLNETPQNIIYSHYSYIRIDNTASVALNGQLYNGKYNALKFHTTFSRTWSTLSNVAPFYIPAWSFSASLEWRFKHLNKLSFL